MKTRTILIAIGVMALAAAAHAGAPPASLEMIPPQINYQGRLMAPDNTPYKDGTHVIDLTLYPTPVGGTTNWSERYSVQTRDGYFSVNLGSGGEGQLVPANLNKFIWQVLWRDVTDATAPNTFYMALTVKTDANGNSLPGAVESSPRQQFLTAPFAYRAHQSVYASKADGVFTAGTINTTNMTSSSISTTNLGVGSITINNTNLNINSQPMFVRRAINENFINTSGGSASFSHGISTNDYDVIIVGWNFGNTTPPPIGHAVSGPTGIFYFATPNSGSLVGSVDFLGVRKGLTHFLPQLNQ